MKIEKEREGCGGVIGKEGWWYICSKHFVCMYKILNKNNNRKKLAKIKMKTMEICSMDSNWSY